MNLRISSAGTKRWYNEQGELHRTDGPAVIYPNGFQSWHFNGNLHRTNGPAMIHPSGCQFWYINGMYHRIDGPAVIRSNGSTCWFIHGNQLTEAEYYDIIQSEEHLNWYLLKIL